MTEISEEDKKRYKEQLDQYNKDLFFITRGRISRLDYLWFVVPFFFLKKYAFIFEDDYGFFPLGSIFTLFIDYLILSLMAKRCRDIGISGWFVLPLAVVSFSIAVYLYVNIHFHDALPDYFLVSMIIMFLLNLPLFLWPSQKRDNKYGPYPAISAFGKYKPEDQK